jgi:signal transduction histidine kinase
MENTMDENNEEVHKSMNEMKRFIEKSMNEMKKSIRAMLLQRNPKKNIEI